VSRREIEVGDFATRIGTSPIKTRTVTTTGTNAAGQTVNNVAVYEKQ
jgi:hypothetical protein